MPRSLGLLALISTTALAQVPAVDLEHVWLEPAGRGSLWVGNGHTLHAGEFRGGASLTFGYGAMRSASESNARTLVSDRFGLQVFGALGVFDWLEVSAVIPAILYQRGSDALPVSQATQITHYTAHDTTHEVLQISPNFSQGNETAPEVT